MYAGPEQNTPKNPRASQPSVAISWIDSQLLPARKRIVEKSHPNAMTYYIINAARQVFRPLRESMVKMAQLGALIRIRISPGVPNLPETKEIKSPWVITSRTPIAASKIPITWSHFRFSLSTSQPRIAMKIGMLATIQPVVVAWEVTNPVDCSHWWKVIPRKPRRAK
jgi:hypothetical protein